MPKRKRTAERLTENLMTAIDASTDMLDDQTYVELCNTLKNRHELVNTIYEPRFCATFFNGKSHPNSVHAREIRVIRRKLESRLKLSSFMEFLLEHSEKQNKLETLQIELDARSKELEALYEERKRRRFDSLETPHT